MKKTVRNAFAMLLALVIACGGITAFAQTPGNIEWYFGDDEAWIYSYAGELSVGEDTVLPPVSEEKSVYLTMNIEESGYYKITVDSDIWFGIPESCTDGKYDNAIDSMAYLDSVSPRYYYLEAGETVVGFDLYEESGVKVKADYVGEITEIGFDRSQLEGRVLGYNIFEIDSDKYGIDVENVNVKFSCGDELDMPWECIYVYTENPLVKGENDVEIGVWSAPYRETATVELIDIADIVESVEFTNLRDYAYLTEYYNGNVYAPSMEGETLTVTYTDGTIETLKNFNGYGCLEKCGFCVDVVYEETDGEWTVVVYLAGQNILEMDCAVRKADTSENLLEYKNSFFGGIQYIISWASMYMNDVITASSMSEAISAAVYAVRSIVSDIGYVFRDFLSKTLALIGSFR